MADTADVLAVNASFYAAFGRRDPDALGALWSRRADATCIHPGWALLEGRDEVLASFRAILTAPNAPDITCARATAHVHGDLAYVICVEVLPGGRLAATNVFVREGASWRMVHHQACPIAPLDAEEQQPPPDTLLN